MKLAHDMCRPESLPKNWSVDYVPGQERRLYTNTVTGEKRREHPLIGYYTGAVFMERGGYERLLQKDTELPPSVKDIHAMAAYLGVKTDEHSFVMEVARMAISSPLPPSWVEVVGRDNNVAYRNCDSGELSKMHPLDVYFIELRNRRRKEVRKNALRQNSLAEIRDEEGTTDVEETLKNLQTGARPRFASGQPFGKDCIHACPSAAESDAREDSKTSASKSEAAIVRDEGEDAPECDFSFVLDVANSRKAMGETPWQLSGSTLCWTDSTDQGTAETSGTDKQTLLSGVSFDGICDGSRTARPVEQHLEAMLRKKAHSGSAETDSFPCLVIASVGNSTEAASSWPTRFESLCQMVVSVDKSLRLRLKTTQLIATDPASAAIDGKPEATSRVRHRIQGAIQSAMHQVVESRVIERLEDVKEAVLAARAGEEKQLVQISLHVAEFCQADEDKVMMRLCLADLMPRGNTAQTQAFAEILLYQFLAAQLSTAPIELATPFQLSDETAFAAQILGGRDDAKKYNKATVLVECALNFADTDCRSWVLLCQRLLACIREVRSQKIPAPERRHKLEIGFLKSCLARIEGSTRKVRQKYAELHRQLDQIARLVQGYAAKHPEEANGEELSDSRFCTTVATLNSWIQLRADNAFHMEQLQEEADELKTRVSEMELENTELTSRMEALAADTTEDRHSECERERAVLEEALVQARQQEMRSKQEMRCIETELQKLRSESQKICDMGKRLKDYEKEIVQLTEEKKKMLRGQEVSAVGLSQLQAEYTALEVEICSLKQREIEQESSVASLQEELCLSRKSLETREDENAVAQQRIADLSAELETLRASQQKTSNELLESRSQAQALQSSIRELLIEKERKEQKTTKLEEQAVVLNQSITELRQSLDSGEEQKRSLEERLRRTDGIGKKIQILERDKAILLDKSD